MTISPGQGLAGEIVVPETGPRQATIVAMRRAKQRQAPVDIGDLDRAAAARRKADLELPMSERLARVHSLSKQIGAIRGAARAAR